MESSKKIREGISVTRLPKNAVYPGKNADEIGKKLQIFHQGQKTDHFLEIEYHYDELAHNCHSVALGKHAHFP